MTPEKFAASIHSKIQQMDESSAATPNGKPYDAFVVLQAADGQSDLLEINQKNFELFGGKQLESGMKLTASSCSAQEDLNDNSHIARLDAAAGLSRTSENQIEVINISQAVQTQSALVNTNETDNSQLTHKTPQISRFFVARSNKQTGEDLSPTSAG